MNAKPPINHSPGLVLADIYYILFRHKWKILLFAAAGIIASVLLPRVWPKVYESEAKLLIQYVLQSRAPAQPGSGDGRVTVSDDAGNIVSTEIEILTSLDLAQEVATNIGPERILGKNGGSDLNTAAAVVQNGLSVDVPNKGDVMRIVFRNSDSTLVRPVLTEVIRTYLERHADIHLAVGRFDDFLTQETDQLRSRLAHTEENLRSVKTNLNIVSIDDSRKVFGDETARIQQSVFDAEAELAERQATVTALAKLVHTNQAETNGADAVDPKPVPDDKVADYKQACAMIDSLKEKERNLLVQYLPENTFVKEVRQQIADAQKNKKHLEEETPGLLTVKITNQKSDNGTDASLQMSFLTENARIAALEAKIKAWTNQLAYIKQRAAAVDASEGQIMDLERTRKLEEGYYTYFSANLAQSRIDEELGPGKASNISTIQNPSPPYRNTGKMGKLQKMLAFAGVAAGIALAFLIEIYFDRSLKRPVEIEARLGVPLLLSIPYRNGNGKARLLENSTKTSLIVRSELDGRMVPLTGRKTTIGRLGENALSLNDESVSQPHCEIYPRNGDFVLKDLGSANGTFVNGERIAEIILKTGQTIRVGNFELKVEAEEATQGSLTSNLPVAIFPSWDPRNVLRPFYDTLRDRLINYFEAKNLTHKPKLVAVTSCGERAGVTSVASGLAAALSETGEGNVLLVDMNAQRGEAHHFRKGRLDCGLDEALQLEKRHEALVQENLYVVTESPNGDNLPGILPKRFTHLVPKLKASDYDYIIFDMPPISQISITPRLARFMDIVMMVVESEKTDRDVVQRAVTMLSEARANVAVVLNKQKSYVPRRIQQEL